MDKINFLNIVIGHSCDENNQNLFKPFSKHFKMDKLDVFAASFNRNSNNNLYIYIFFVVVNFILRTVYDLKKAIYSTGNYLSTFCMLSASSIILE